MEGRKVLIADPSEDFRHALTQMLLPDFQVRCCSRGDRALELAREWVPDVLVLELSLPGLDGIGLLRQLKLMPAVLVVTDLNTPFVRSVLEELGVQYAMLRTCAVQTVADRVHELSRLCIGQSRDSGAVQLLSHLGVPNSRQGFQHMLTGLPDLVRQRDQRLSKELYQIIASRSSATSASVEKAIRDAIRAGWDTGDRSVWQQYFPGCTRCPRNKEFLFRIADLLREQGRCG